MAGTALPITADAALVERTIFAGQLGADGRVGTLTYDDARRVSLPLFLFGGNRLYDTAFVITDLLWQSAAYGVDFQYVETADTAKYPGLYFPKRDVFFQTSLDGFARSAFAFDNPVGDGFEHLEFGDSVDGGPGRWNEFLIPNDGEIRSGFYRTEPGSVVPVPGGLLLIGSAMAALGLVGASRARGKARICFGQ